MCEYYVVVQQLFYLKSEPSDARDVSGTGNLRIHDTRRLMFLDLPVIVYSIVQGSWVAAVIAWDDPTCNDWFNCSHGYPSFLPEPFHAQRSLQNHQTAIRSDKNIIHTQSGLYGAFETRYGSDCVFFSLSYPSTFNLQQRAHISVSSYSFYIILPAF